MKRWIEVAPGIRVTGDGAAWLPDEGTIVVADVHLGYELAAQRRGGYLPPVESGAEVGRRLADLASEYGAHRVVIAGDLRHSTRDVDQFERTEIVALAVTVRARHRLHVVLGNHDAGADIVGESSPSLRIGAVNVIHEPPAMVPSQWTICGHLHPRTTVRDETGASSRFACALVGERILVLPAWSDWAGGAEVTRLMGGLPASAWRALPVHGGLVGDLGLAWSRPTD